MNTPLRRLLTHFKGRILGTALGIIVAIFIILFGFINTVFIAALGAVGYMIGTRLDGDESLRDLLERILPPVE